MLTGPQRRVSSSICIFDNGNKYIENSCQLLFLLGKLRTEQRPRTGFKWFQGFCKNKCWPHCVWRQVSSRESVGRAWPHFTSLTSNVIFRTCLPCRVGHIILLSDKTCLCCWVLRMGTCLAFNASNSMAHSCPLYCPHPCSLLPSGVFQLRVAGIKQVEKLSGPKSWVQRSKNESSKTIEKAAFNVIFLRATASEATGRGTTTNFKPPPIRPHRLCWLHHSYPCLPCNQ